MELIDFIITPFFIILAFVVAYVLRPWLTDDINRKYFIPALSLKIFGALALGFIYQFYYSGGDTYNYHTHGSRHVWRAIIDNPSVGAKLLFTDGTEVPSADTYKYASKIIFYTDPSSYAVVKIAAVFDLFTFSSYPSTAVLFALFSFLGMWLLFRAFYDEYPHLHVWIAVATFFIPSVFFWGSGLLKDTITLSALGATTFFLKRLFIEKRISIFYILLLLISMYVIFAVKKYILICYLPAALLWISLGSFFRIRSLAIRILLIPFLAAATIFAGYYSVVKIGEDDRRYSIDKIAITAQVTAYDIGFYTGRDAGSGYSLGELDGTFSGMLKLAPQAINVALFRPYLWEARNPLMLLSALESFVMLGLTVYIISKKRFRLFQVFNSPDIIFCLVFALVFAFAVGVSTFNFGTLTRYKIPLMPFYFIALTLMLHYPNNETNDDALETTE